MVKFTVNCPAGMLTCGGTCTFGSLLVSVTASAPVGAGAVSLMVPTAVVPPIMTLSGTVTDAMHAGKGGLIVRLAEAIPQFAVEAERDAGVTVPTPVVFTLKVAEVCPAGT